MKNILIFFLLCVLVLFSGLFIVDEREVAVITHSANDSKVYPTGIHWNIPFYGNLSYVYLNQRNSFITIELNNISKHQTELAKLDVAWSVIDPIKYVNYLNQYGRKKFDENMADVLEIEVLATIIKEATTDAGLINYLNNQAFNVIDIKSGIKISTVKISSIKVMNTDTNNEPQVKLSAESAYAEAILIVQDANKEKQQALDKLKAQNPQFYNYYSLIRQYQMTAKNKNDVPAFDKLYSR